VRGRKWYDGAQVLVRSPWELLRSLPGTVMLLLWSAGIAVAAAKTAPHTNSVIDSPATNA